MNVIGHFKATSLKQHFYILIFASALAACNQNASTTNDQKTKAVTTKVISDKLKTNKNDNITDRKITPSDSLIIFDDSLFKNIELNLIEISKNDFLLYKNKYKTVCTLDSGHFIRGSGLYISNRCNEICDTYLVEKATNRRMLLPSNYDAGMLSMLLSPVCNQLIVCSSYDGPNYENYYQDRAEIFIFNVALDSGLKGIKPAFKYYTKDWSIDNLTWISDKAIALKVYDEQRQQEGNSQYFKYFKANIDR